MLALIGFGKEISVIYVIIGAMGFSIGVPGVTFAMIPDHFPLKVLELASGLVNALSGVGFILGPLIAGNIATKTGSFVHGFPIDCHYGVCISCIITGIKTTNSAFT